MTVIALWKRLFESRAPEIYDKQTLAGLTRLRSASLRRKLADGGTSQSRGMLSVPRMS